MDFYSYLWLREDGTPYYVGKGSGNRAFTNKGHNVHRPVSKSRIVVFPMVNEAEAFESEIALIDLFGRKDVGTGYLLNRTGGGENPPNLRGRKKPASFSQFIARRNRILGQSAETKEKIRAAMTGTHWSLESRAKMSKTLRGKPHSLAHTAAISLALKGKPWSEARRKAQKVK